jgi:hypothetical protein
MTKLRPAFRWLVTASLSMVALAGCCSDETDVEAGSPDGRFLARSVVRNCGATAGFVTVIEVEDQQALVLDTHHIVTLDGHGGVGLRWTSPAELRVDLPADVSLAIDVYDAGPYQVRFERREARRGSRPVLWADPPAKCDAHGDRRLARRSARNG